MLTRLALVLFGCLVAVALIVGSELALRVTGWADAIPRPDPFAGFSEDVPLFEGTRDADGRSIYHVASIRLARKTPAPDEPQRSFLAKKPSGTFRVFALGGSSTAGTPYGTMVAYPFWLQERLRAALPDRSIEVINAAVPGYATTRELNVVRELVRFSPDLLVLYTGHNEMLESRTYEHLLSMDPRTFALWRRLADTRLHRLASSLFGRWVPAPTPPQAMLRAAEQVQSNLLPGAERFATPRELAYRALHFRHNLEQMTRLMRAAGGQTVLVTLGQNFADFPPSRSQHRAGLAAADKNAWRRAVRDGDRLFAAGRIDESQAAYRRALAIDDGHALLQAKVGRGERALEHWDEARRRYHLASDLDRLTVGAPTAYNGILREVATAEHAIFVDAEAALEAAAEHRLIGDRLFCDPVHPSIRGHQVIAAAIADGLRAAGVPAQAAAWQLEKYVEPDAQTLYDNNPRLRAREDYLRGAVLLWGRDLAGAERFIEAAVQADPTYTDAVETLARLRAARGQPTPTLAPAPAAR